VVPIVGTAVGGLIGGILGGMGGSSLGAAVGRWFTPDDKPEPWLSGTAGDAPEATAAAPAPKVTVVDRSTGTFRVVPAAVPSPADRADNQSWPLPPSLAPVVPEIPAPLVPVPAVSVVERPIPPSTVSFAPMLRPVI